MNWLPAWLLSLVGKVQVWAGIALAVVAAIGIAFLRGRSAGIQHIEAEQAKRRIESIQKRKEIDDDVSQMGSSDIDREYDRWLRDKR